MMAKRRALRGTAWKVAKSLLHLRDQINHAVPDRKRQNDGTIGDAAHSARVSDHNPNMAGVVCAMDITHDPKGGCDSYALAETLRAAKDKRIKYVISNRKIFSSGSAPWQWRPYHGANPHDCHVHVSVKGPNRVWDDTTDWDIGTMAPQHDAPEVVEHPRLQRGDTGEAVRVLQNLLLIDADGVFAAATEKALVEFQKAHKLAPDGIAGNYTWRELDAHPVRA